MRSLWEGRIRHCIRCSDVASTAYFAWSHRCCLPCTSHDTCQIIEGALSASQCLVQAPDWLSHKHSHQCESIVIYPKLWFFVCRLFNKSHRASFVLQISEHQHIRQKRLIIVERPCLSDVFLGNVSLSSLSAHICQLEFCIGRTWTSFGQFIVIQRLSRSIMKVRSHSSGNHFFSAAEPLKHVIMFVQWLPGLKV